MRPVEQIEAIFRSGEIMGIASSINIKSLEKFLENPDPTFRYAQYCKAVLELARLVQDAQYCKEAVLELARLVQGVTVETTNKENKTE